MEIKPTKQEKQKSMPHNVKIFMIVGLLLLISSIAFIGGAFLKQAPLYLIGVLFTFSAVILTLANKKR